MSETNDLPPEIERGIAAFVDSAKAAFESDLVAVVLYGSAAEGRLRATSDVNTLLVIRRFDRSQADRMREPLRTAHATVQLNAMFLLESEVPMAMEAFAVKFADILARHRVLHGSDPFANLASPRDAVIRRLRQVLLNLQLRLRERYVLVSLREEQLALVIADAAGPLRASAASLLHLEGHDAPAPKEALDRVVKDMDDPVLAATLQDVSTAREDRQLGPAKSAPALMGLIEITRRLRERVERLP
jgi:hypothetical protein